MKTYQQSILFGSPGTGKSFRVKNEVLPELGIKHDDSTNSFRTVFHPEYTYGDFMGKLLPLTKNSQVEYKYYAGVFLKAIAQAYKNILDSDPSEEDEYTNVQNVALVIDEINRGNSAAIFGMGFQLLDRDADGWSTYEVAISDMEFDALLELIGVEIASRTAAGKPSVTFYTYGKKQYEMHELDDFLHVLKIKQKQIRIPGNLSIIATMNTSDSSIYHMDSAFKRRWGWQYVNIDSSTSTDLSGDFFDEKEWRRFVDKLNGFIKSKHQFVRKAEDKLIGYYFIQGKTISWFDIQNKVMFFIWDSVFTTSKTPLTELLEMEEADLVTFGDFANQVKTFINKILGQNV